jgi:succinyl-CoA synthetase beta subunit
MRFYEFEAKQLLQKYRIPLVQSEVAKTADEAQKVASDIGGPVIVKAQAIAPGLAAASMREVSDPAGPRPSSSGSTMAAVSPMAFSLKRGQRAKRYTA